MTKHDFLKCAWCGEGFANRTDYNDHLKIKHTAATVNRDGSIQQRAGAERDKRGRVAMEESTRRRFVWGQDAAENA